LIKKLSHWIKKYPQQTELLLMTAKVRIKNEEWNEAKNLVEEAISIEATEESFCILGEILFHFGKVDSACEAYRKGMKMKINKSQPIISP
jgi:HemY protein